jgi:hypothetical protein
LLEAPGRYSMANLGHLAGLMAEVRVLSATA